MNVSKSMTLADQYVKINTENHVSYGGNQNWFSPFPSFREKLIHRGGCGLVASIDLVSYIQKRAGVPLLYTDRESYMALLRRHSHVHYPIFPKAGSFSFEVLFYVNHMLRKSHLKERIHFLFTFSKKKRLDTVKASLAKGDPLILIIGQHFLRFGCKKGVTFYRESDGIMMPVYHNVYCHFVNVTGMVIPEDIKRPVYLEIASWGDKYYIDFEELSRYISRYSFPTFSGFFYLK